MTAEEGIALETACLGYMLQWSTLEKGFFDGLRSQKRDERLRALNRAAAFFRIARNLPIKREQGAERLSPVLDMFDRLPENPPDDVTAAVVEFQGRLSAVYGRRALSFSSKVLWLRYRAPVVIYDAQARRALNVSALDYGTYLKAWLSQYQRHSETIRSTCNRLAAVLTIPEAHRVLGHDWFHQRVFDQYLWARGKQKS